MMVNIALNVNEYLKKIVLSKFLIKMSKKSRKKIAVNSKNIMCHGEV